MPSEEAKRRLLTAAAEAYARSYGRVPPESREALEDELDRQTDGGLRTTVTEALWWTSYDEFRRAVQAALLRPVNSNA